MAGYTRTDTTNNIATGNVINAADFDGEYNAIETAFNATGGHAHDGTAGGGARILKLGPAGNLTISAGAVTPLSNNAIDLGTSGAQFKDLYIDGTAYIDAIDGDVLIGPADVDSKIQFRDSAIYINSSVDGQLDIVADTEVQIAATTVDINGNVDISGTLTIGGANISEAELEVLDGATVSTTELNYLNGTTLGTVVASKVLAVDNNKDITGFRNISLTGTVDGIDIATRDAVLTSTTTTAGAALPKAGGALTGAVTTNSTFDGVDIATRDGVLTSTTTTANAALPKTGGAMTGAITTNSTFDGRDVGTDGTKLDGIEASATADQTNAEIRTAVEAATDSNVFTDADHTKLNAIEASADVTDATNVTAAGALMRSGGAMTGAITTNSTFDGVDIATRDAVLTSTTTTANAAMPKAGGVFSGAVNFGSSSLSINGDTISNTDGSAGDIDFQLGTASTSEFRIKASRDDATVGPNLIFQRSSTSPADNDMVGKLEMQCQVTGGGYQGMSQITTQMVDNNSSAPKGAMYLNAREGSGTGDVWTGLAVIGKTAKLYYSDSQKLETVTGGVNVTGDMVASGNVTAYSDERLKDNITTIKGALDLVSDMRGVTYDMEGRAGVGVIAQEIQKVLPEVVSEQVNEEYLSVAYGNISGVLIEAIKELRAEVDHLSKTACTCKCTCKTPEV